MLLLSRTRSRIARLRYQIAHVWFELKSFAYQVAASPVTAVLLGILAILIGVAGAIAANDFPCSWPLSLMGPLPKICTQGLLSISSNPALSIFWFSLAVFTLLLFGRELAVVWKTNRERTELLYTVRTMPPPRVMEAFHATYTDVREFIETKVIAVEDPGKNLAAIESGIKYCLGNIVALADNFQRSFETTRYAANIMTYVNVGSIKDKDKILAAMKSLQETNSFDGLAGVLYLHKELSVASDAIKTDAEQFPSDPFLTGDLAIPVPSQLYNPSPHGGRGRARFLPGAAEALVNGNYIIDDTCDYLNKYEENQDFWDLPRTIIENIDRYFREDSMGQHVRSFVSIAIKSSEANNPATLGVVNIHCNRPNIFQDEWVYKSFLALCAPLVVEIAKLLKKRTTFDPDAS